MAPSVAEEVEVADNAQPAVSMRSTPMTREEIRAWAEGLDLPVMKLAYVDEEIDGQFKAPSGPGIVTPADADEIMIQNADAAHALGFDGTGVRIAIVDTGLDLTHPDLYNVSARVTDPASPYFLHPINYLSASLNDLILFGSPTPALPFGDNQPFNSWFVDTSFSTTVVEFNTTWWVNWTDGTTNLSWNVTGVSGLSAGEEVRLGFHPDDKFLPLFGMRPAVLLFNGTGAGAPYDMILADLDVDLSFVLEEPAWINTDWASFDPMAELVTRDLDLDGFADLSGGVLTFISDGVREIPYASGHIDAMNFTYQTMFNDDTFDIWAAVGVDPTANIVPPAGDLVFLMGDFDLPVTNGAHGSWIASTIAGQGITGGFGGGPVISGMAPGAKLIGVGGVFDQTDPFVLQTGLFTGQIFATQGYDALSDTGDEAHITSNSWGGFDYSGWSWSSRFMDYVSNVLADERTLFVFAAGNSGPGYGNLFDPAGAPGVVTSGSMDNWNYRDDPWFDFEGGPNPSYGDLSDFSTRGPSVLGRHKVDALTSGHFGYSADPLNGNPFVGDSGAALDGNSSWILWSGTSLSTPNLSGILALIYDAYMQAHGGLAPMGPTAKTILKNSADDARLDPFLAGAGIANALRGVLIANETDGLTLGMNEWNPGDYHGVSYPSYANVLLPGGADVVTVNLTNHRQTASLTVDMADTVMDLDSHIATNFTRTPGTAAEYFILNETGLFASNGTLIIPTAPGLFSSADMLRVSMWIDRSRMAELPVYGLRLLDWTDANANGSFDGVDEENLMNRHFDFVFFDEIGPNGFGFIQDPANRTHDGLIIRLEVRFEALLAGDITFDLRVDYYKRTDFPWLDIVGPPTIVIPAASTMPVDLSITLPGDADPGLYEAIVLFTLDNGDVTTLPVVVNVAASGLPMFFGGNTYDSGIYQQGVQYGASDDFDTGSGDFRYYFLDLPEAATVTVLLEWDDNASSNDLYVLTNVTDWFSETLPGRYGPGTVEEVAFESSGSNGLSSTASLNKGLSIILVGSTHLAGIAVEEHPVGRVGTISVSPPSLTGVGVPVEGTETITITSEFGFPDIQGMVEVETGVGTEATFLDLPVDSFPYAGQSPWEQYLFEAPNRFVTTIGPGVFRVSYEMFFHSGATDVDFGIFYDADCDDVYTLADDVIGSVASTGDNPERAGITNPPPGCYVVHAGGFEVDAGGGLYDLTLALVEPFMTISSLPTSIDPGVPVDVVIDYALAPISQAFVGTVIVGSAQFPRAIQIPVSLVPDLPPELSGQTPADGSLIASNTPTVGLDWQDAADAFETAVDPDSLVLIVDGADLSSVAVATTSGMALNLPFALADGAHSISVEVHDENGSQNRTAWTFTIDSTVPDLVITAPTVPITNDPMVTVAGSTEPGASVTVDGSAVTVDALGAFTVDLTLADGTHSISVVSTDGAGNSASTTVDITVDTVAPTISLSSPSSGSTVEIASVEVAGSTEAGASVSVNGIAVSVDANGAFSFSLALAPGSNTITAVATDLAGNSGSTSVSVTFDDPVPALLQDLDNANDGLNTAQGNLADLQTQVLIAIIIAVVGVAMAGVGLWWGMRKG